MRKFWIHSTDDSVGVAVADIEVGESVSGVYMGTKKEVRLKSREGIQLGHKIALKNIPKGGEVIEYGEVIGQATRPIDQGQHVHVHNLKSLRWNKR